MKALYLLILVSAQAAAWPWTTVDDCVEKYVPKAETNQGAKIVRNACVSKYQNKSPNDGLFDCIMDKVPSAKTDTAASMMLNLCRKENPPRITDEERRQAELYRTIDADLRAYQACLNTMRSPESAEAKESCLTSSASNPLNQYKLDYCVGVIMQDLPFPESCKSAAAK